MDCQQDQHVRLQAGSPQQLEVVQQQQYDVLADNLRQFLIRIHHKYAVVGAQWSSVDQHRVRVSLDLVLLAVLVEEVLSDFVGLSERGVRFPW